MTRHSNRGRGGHGHHQTSQDRKTQRVDRNGQPVDRSTDDNGTGLPSSNGGSIGADAGIIGAGAASAMERDSQPGAAPPGGGAVSPRAAASGAHAGGGRGRARAAGDDRHGHGGIPRPPGLPLGVTWWPGCGRKARTGDVAAGQRSTTALTVLSGRDGGRKLRCSGRLSPSEARAIAKHAATGATTGVRVLLDKGGRDPGRPIPNAASDRTRAVLSMTRRVIGRPVGIRECMRGLRAIGWCK